MVLGFPSKIQLLWTQIVCVEVAFILAPPHTKVHHVSPPDPLQTYPKTIEFLGFFWASNTRIYRKHYLGASNFQPMPSETDIEWAHRHSLYNKSTLVKSGLSSTSHNSFISLAHALWALQSPSFAQDAEVRAKNTHVFHGNYKCRSCFTKYIFNSTSKHFTDQIECHSIHVRHTTFL